MDNKNLGTANFTRSYDTDFVTGSGVRPYNWGLGLSVQQEVLPRVSVNVGYFRNWWGNWYAVDNRRDCRTADFTPFSLKAPVDARLPGRRRLHASTACTTWFPPRSARTTNSRPSSSNFGKMTENWQGVDINAVARLRNGLTIQGGTSTGRRLQDACDVRANLVEYGAGASGQNNSIAGSVDGNAMNPTNP